MHSTPNLTICAAHQCSGRLIVVRAESAIQRVRFSLGRHDQSAFFGAARPMRVPVR
jgi:hypothetical protein